MQLSHSTNHPDFIHSSISYAAADSENSHITMEQLPSEVLFQFFKNVNNELTEKALACTSSTFNSISLSFKFHKECLYLENLKNLFYNTLYLEIDKTTAKQFLHLLSSRDFLELPTFEESQSQLKEIKNSILLMIQNLDDETLDCLNKLDNKELRTPLFENLFEVAKISHLLTGTSESEDLKFKNNMIAYVAAELINLDFEKGIEAFESLQKVELNFYKQVLRSMVDKLTTEKSIFKMISYINNIIEDKDLKNTIEDKDLKNTIEDKDLKNTPLMGCYARLMLVAPKKNVPKYLNNFLKIWGEHNQETKMKHSVILGKVCLVLAQIDDPRSQEIALTIPNRVVSIHVRGELQKIRSAKMTQ